MPPRRRRKPRRHALNPLGWITAESFANITRVVAVIAAASVPTMVVNNQQGKKVAEASADADTARTQTQYANANTNAALGALFVITQELEALKAEVAKLRGEMRGVKHKSPEQAFGPEVPAGWVAQPVKRKGWFARHFGG